MGTTTKEIGSSSFNDMISSVDRRSEYVENRAGANVRLNNFLTPTTLDDKSSILNAPCGYSNGVYASLRPSDARGPELVGTIEQDSSFPFTSFTDNGSGSYTCDSNGSGFMGIEQPDADRFSVSTGERYVLSFDYQLNSGSNALQIFIGSGAVGSSYSGPPIIMNSNGSFSYVLDITTDSSVARLSTQVLNSTTNFTISNISIKKDTSADFDFTRGTAATRVTKDGLVKDVQILSDDLVKNGNFEEIGPELISNGDFSQEGSELVVNGGFDTDSDWTKGSGWSIEGGEAVCDGSQTSNSLLYQSSVLASGNNFKCEVTISDYQSGNLRVVLGGGGSEQSYSANGTYTFYGSKGSDNNLYLSADSNFQGSIDNVSVVEVGQDWSLGGTDWSIGDDKLIGVNAITETLQTIFPTTGTRNLKISFDVVVDSGSVAVYMDGETKVWITSSGSVTRYVTSNTRTLEIDGRNSDPFNGSVTNISVKEVGQNWSFGTGWSMGDGKVFGTSASANLQQSVSVSSGRTYRVELDVTRTSGTLFCDLGSSSAFSTTSSGKLTFLLKTTSSNNLRFYGGSFTGSIDNVSVIEITDDTNLPRIDYTNGTGALLLEPQSTNLITYSEDFSQWTNTRSSDLIGFISPTGENNATKFISDNTASSSHIIKSSNFTISSGQKYTYSVFVKANQLNYVRLLFTDSSVSKFLSVYFNLTNGTVGATSDGSTATLDSSNIENFGNGWFRCSVSGDLDTTTTAHARIYLAEADNDAVFDGDGTSSIYIWGAQLEEGYATSYIPTNGSTVTRNADVCNNAGSSDLINSTEGVLYAEYKPTFASGSRQMSISDGTFNNRVVFECRENGTKFKIYVVSGGSSQAEITFPVPNLDDFYKAAIKYKSNDVSFYVNGELIGTDTIATMPIGLNVLAFSGRNDTSLKMEGNIRSVAVFKEALTDEELAKITSTTQQEVFYEMRDKMLQINADYYEFGDYTTRLKKLF